LDIKKQSEFGKKSASTFIECNFGADSHLSDMLIVPLSLCKDLSIFTIKEISKHLETNLYITSTITGCRYGVAKIAGGFEIRLQGSSEPSI
jgi:RNA 3'-terminal phosphate cyclase (ATP)